MDILVPIAATLFLAGFAAWVSVLALRELSALRAARLIARDERELLRQKILQIAEQRRREKEKAERTWDGFRKFVVARKEVEATDICSFYLEPHDQRPLPPFEPGQYLTFRLNIAGQTKSVIRCYSLSDAPDPARFRVTIKRVRAMGDLGKAGLASGFMHDQVEAGDILDVKAPAGHFVLKTDGDGPIVLIAGGIGLTPLFSMLNALVRANSERDIWLFYGVRHGAEHAMADTLRQIATENPNVRLHVCYSHPREELDVSGQHYHSSGFLSADLLKRTLPSHEGDFYLCGPPPMMQSMFAGLAAWGVAEKHIHFEAFGPASVKSHAAPATAAAVNSGHEIAFSKSGRTITWDGRSTLLEIAEANGIQIDAGCRAGNCGTCLTAVKRGDVSYSGTTPGMEVEAGSCLACIALPASSVVIEA
jgi:ferredoxin-NADP reductase